VSRRLSSSAFAVVLVFAAAALVAPTGVAASERVHALDGSELRAWDEFFLRRAKPIDFQRGLGHVGMRVSTDSALAQSWFDQGLALLFGYSHEDAIYSFKRALDMDPGLAMAWWGIAWAYGANINLDASKERATRALEAINRAKDLARDRPPKAREMAYIRALDGRYQIGFKPLPDKDHEEKDRRDLDIAFFDRMKQLYRDDPSDVNAAAFTAEAGLDISPWNQWDRDGRPTPNTLLIVGILKDALERDRHHIGLQHFLIHALEASPDPDQAALAAWRLKTDGFGQPHLVHMPSHIYLRDGDWGAAMVSGEDAKRGDVLYRRQNGTNNLFVLSYGGHNIHVQAWAASMAGRERVAVANARQLRARVARYSENLLGREHFQFYEILMRTRFGQWQRVLEMPSPPSILLGARAMRHYARGVAFARRGQPGDRERGAEELAELVDLRNGIGGRRGYPEFALNGAPPVLDVAIAVLKGRLAWAEGERGQAVRRFGDAVLLQDRLRYDEPPTWYFPAGEALGAALVEMREYGQAAAAFRDVLKKYPGDGWALFGLTEALRRGGASATAIATADRRFSRAWRWADRPLTLDDLL
jgi:tetratricopeptide (TPR) repeat protein